MVYRNTITIPFGSSERNLPRNCSLMSLSRARNVSNPRSACVRSRATSAIDRSSELAPCRKLLIRLHTDRLFAYGARMHQRVSFQLIMQASVRQRSAAPASLASQGAECALHSFRRSLPQLASDGGAFFPCCYRLRVVSVRFPAPAGFPCAPLLRYIPFYSVIIRLNHPLSAMIAGRVAGGQRSATAEADVRPGFTAGNRSFRIRRGV